MICTEYSSDLNLKNFMRFIKCMKFSEYSFNIELKFIFHMYQFFFFLVFLVVLHQCNGSWKFPLLVLLDVPRLVNNSALIFNIPVGEKNSVNVCCENQRINNSLYTPLWMNCTFCVNYANLEILVFLRKQKKDLTGTAEGKP